MRITHQFIAAIGVTLLSSAASADPGTQWGTRWLNGREAHQDVRTDAGIATGALTEREVARIEHRATVLDYATDRALSDGDLSGQEFRALNRAYTHNSRFIYRQKHDRQGN